MAKMTEKALRDKCRVEFVDMLVEMLEMQGIDCYRTKDGEFGVERWDDNDILRKCKITVAIPTGARGEKESDAFDMYTAAEIYQQSRAEKERKAKEKAAKEISE